MYTIKHAAEVTGVSVATLRAWERRYGIVTPQRTEAGYRLYDDEAVRALSVMNALVVEGWAPRQAAAETLRRIESGDDVAPVVLDSAADSADLGEPAGTAVFVDAAARLDAVALAEVLDERFSRGSFESVVDGWLMPALRALGEGWAEGRVSVAGGTWRRTPSSVASPRRTTPRPPARQGRASSSDCRPGPDTSSARWPSPPRPAGPGWRPVTWAPTSRPPTGPQPSPPTGRPRPCCLRPRARTSTVSDPL